MMSIGMFMKSLSPPRFPRMSLVCILGTALLRRGAATLEGVCRARALVLECLPRVSVFALATILQIPAITVVQGYFQGDEKGNASNVRRGSDDSDVWYECAALSPRATDSTGYGAYQSVRNFARSAQPQARWR